ncbi:MAG: hypothetical protein FWD37_05195 [Methanomassiliicoccaceae archaeon]|nr:hypothetical protein [Methanomassiliicoccaceae archaeon]
MRTLIAFSTKSGASRECAEILASKIDESVMYDLNGGTPNIDDYDVVIIGTGIRIGGAYKPFKKFIKENENALLKKKIAFFTSNLLTKTFPEIVEKNIPLSLQENAICMRTFGGRPLIGGKKDQKWLLRDEVDAFVQEINNASQI